MTTAAAPTVPAEPPGPGRTGTLAALRERRKGPLRMFGDLRDAHGPVVHFPAGKLDMYLVAEPDLIQQVLTVHADKVRKGRVLDGAKVLLGEGLLTGEGPPYRRRRRLIQPAFHHERLAGYADAMSRQAAAVADGWADGAVVDVFSEMTGLTMGVVAETLFGAELGAERRRVETALVDILRGFDLIVQPLSGLRMRLPTRTVRRFRAAVKDMNRLVDSVIADRRADPVDRGDLLSMLLLTTDEDGVPAMDDAEVRHEVMTLFAAGLETTANALTFTWWLLGRHPEVAIRLREEADAFGASLPGLADLPRLAYTQAVLEESMRLYPPAWMIARRVTADLPLGPYVLPAGSLVMMPPWLVHRDERFWPDPERFDPDRFLPGAAPAHKYAYLPFSAGPRKCIGSSFATIEGTLLLATIARRVALEPLDDAPIELQPQITLRPKGGLRMRARRR